MGPGWSSLAAQHIYCSNEYTLLYSLERASTVPGRQSSLRGRPWRRQRCPHGGVRAVFSQRRSRSGPAGLLGAAASSLHPFVLSSLRPFVPSCPHRSLTRGAAGPSRGPHSAVPAPMGAPPGTLGGARRRFLAGQSSGPSGRGSGAQSPVRPRLPRPAAAKVRPRQQQNAPGAPGTADDRGSLSTDTACILERILFILSTNSARQGGNTNIF